ncbi:hypothetical protein DVH24_005766 [Malus domestica]|uniref:Uncharacterized protein n=1 Tax=Malus domestica TaxID=3750 RepID=A0A498IQJ8_MALDO|nr:hypothetical protein DVH24_005766 [Malus domestica]
MGYICLKMVKHCVPHMWNKPVPGGRWDAKTPKICPVEQLVPPIFGAPNAGQNASSRSVPSHPTTNGDCKLKSSRRAAELGGRTKDEIFMERVV